MDENPGWQARYDALRATLRNIGVTLGDQTAPHAAREEAATEFITTWQALTQHIKQQPETSGTIEPHG